MAFPGTYNFNYYNGDSFEFFVYPKTSNGQVFDSLEDYSAKFTIATARGSEEAIVLASNSSTGSTQLLATVEDNDHVVCEILPTGGETLQGSSYVYDVEIENPLTGKVYTLLTGTISVTQDISG
jgi:hypothetical protein